MVPAMTGKMKAFTATNKKLITLALAKRMQSPETKKHRTIVIALTLGVTIFFGWRHESRTQHGYNK